MSTLIDSVKSYLNPGLVGSMATRINEKEANVYQASIAYATAILAGISSRVNDASFVELVHNLLKADNLTEAVDHPNDILLEPNGSKHISKDVAEKVLGSVFGNRVPELVTGIASTNGLGSKSAAYILSVIGPMVMGVLHKKIAAGNLSQDNFAHLLASEKSKLLSDMPAGIGSALGMAGLVSPMHTIDELPPPGKRGNWLLPVLIVLVILIAFMIWKGKS